MTGVAGGKGDEPREAPIGGLPEAPPCPFCEGGETELVNAFGSHASVSTYWCRDCRSPFEVMKWTRRPGRGTAGEGRGGMGRGGPGD